MKRRALFLTTVIVLIVILSSCNTLQNQSETNASVTTDATVTTETATTSNIPVNTEPVASEGLEYTPLDDGTYEVSGIGTCTDTNIVISSTYNGKSVTSIGESAFYDCESLTSITIPDSVTSIGDEAFSGCTSLTSITIPDSVTSIGKYAFEVCSSLTSITIPESVTSIGEGAFDGCNSLESITVEEGNTVYHSSGNCLVETTSKTLVLGCKTSAIPTDGSVTSIGYDAFSGCSSLTSITIPDGVTSIGKWAFSRCSSLESITIPDSVTSIGDYAFSRCASLTSITFNGTKKEWEAIEKGSSWNKNTGDYTIHCTDGDISKSVFDFLISPFLLLNKKFKR